MAANDGEDSDIGHAKTRTPVAGVPHVAASPLETPREPREDTMASQLAERPESDKLARAVAKSRVASKLFTKAPEQVKLGRYHLLDVVGAGGMGVVWGAWDPELDRRVAIKLLKAEMLAARERIVVEGQALAKLSHPNVIAIYDVGVVDEQVYLVMEWVRGKNLRAYCREPRTIREIVALYRAAGEGLLAAHRVGLIHRDFKPDNAMIGDDGRVRVLDFGLARGEVKVKTDSTDSDSPTPQPSSDLTRGAGTPRYMPVEQAEGHELTPAVDQYALGVSLREALVGRNADGKEADIPRWLNEIIIRATARDAANRYPSMEALLAALSRDPATIWRRRGIVAGALALAGGMFVVGTLRADTVDECGGGTEEIAKAWNPALGEKLATHLTALGPYGAEEAKRVVPDMTKYSARWADTHKRVCKANERKELTPQLYDVRLACLARAQVALQTVTDIFSRASRERLGPAIVAFRALPDVELCATETSSTTIEAPPRAIAKQVEELSNEISKVRYLSLATDPSVQALAKQLTEKAIALGYAPLVGRARLALGVGTFGDGKGARDAVPEFAAARAAALQAGDRVTFVEAYAREVYALNNTGNTERPLDVEATHAMVEDLSAGMKNEGQFERALLLNNLGTRWLKAGQIEKAHAYFERAWAVPQLGKRDVELYAAMGNLAIATEDRVKRRALFVEERKHLERELGANHPFTITNWMRGAAHTIDNPVEAANELRDACTKLMTFHTENQRRIDTCNYELGWLAAERGDAAEMKSTMAAVQWADNQYLPIAKAYLLFADGKLDDVARTMEEYGQKFAAEKGWWDRNVGAAAFMIASLAYEKLGQPERAVPLLETSLVIFEDPGFNKSASYYKRKLARTRAMLAKLVAKTKPETAKSLAKEALAWYREAGGYEATIAELEKL
jgi:tetratricopeptide (TPR) repeat protein